MQKQQFPQFPIEDSLGCGALGCAGGLLLGVFGGGFLLILVALVWAMSASVPSPSPADSSQTDLRLTLHETFLNRVVQDTTGGMARLDIMPENRLVVTSDVDVSSLGLSVPIQVIGIFELQLAGQSLDLHLVDMEISGLNLPVDLSGVFDSDVAAVNQDLNMALQELSAGLGTPIVLTGLSSDETSLLIEAREAP